MLEKKSAMYWTIFVGIIIIFLTASSGFVFAQDHPSEVSNWLDNIKDNYGGTTIRVSMASHPSTEAFRRMVDEFEEETGIEVEWDIMSESRLRPTHFSLATAGSSSFDVWMTDGFYIQEYVSKDTIEPLNKFLDKEITPEWFDYEDIIPAYRSAIAFSNGEPYGVPIAGESRFIAYRKDLFEQYDIKPPETTEELLEAAEFFNDNVEDVYGFTSRAQRGIFYASGWLHVLYQFSDGWIDQETGEVIADSPEVIESLKYWNELLKNGPPDIASYTHEEASSAFMNGNAAIWFDATAIAGWLVDPEKSNVYDKVGWLAPPEGPKGRYGGLAGWNLTVPKTSNKKDAAWAFIVWMTSRYNAPNYIKNGGVLVRTSLLTNEDIISEHPEMYAAMKETFDAAKNLTDKGIVWIPPTWLANPVLQEAGNYGNLSLVGDITEEEAVERLAEDIREMQDRWK